MHAHCTQYEFLLMKSKQMQKQIMTQFIVLIKVDKSQREQLNQIEWRQESISLGKLLYKYTQRTCFCMFYHV